MSSSSGNSSKRQKVIDDERRVDEVIKDAYELLRSCSNLKSRLQNSHAPETSKEREFDDQLQERGRTENNETSIVHQQIELCPNAAQPKSREFVQEDTGASSDVITVSGGTRELRLEMRDGGDKSKRVSSKAKRSASKIKASETCTKSVSAKVTETCIEVPAVGSLLRKAKGKEVQAQTKPTEDGLFSGICAFFVEDGISNKRLEIWKQRFKDLGGLIFSPRNSKDGNATHVLAAGQEFLTKAIKVFKRSKNLCFLRYEWLETCLREGRLMPTTQYLLSNPKSVKSAVQAVVDEKKDGNASNFEAEEANRTHETSIRIINPDVVSQKFEGQCQEEGHELYESESDKDVGIPGKSNQPYYAQRKEPDLNEHLTKPLSEMWHIYEDVLGDEWRALNYRKVVNKLRGLNFKVNSADDLKHVAGIGSSMLHKVKEILGTGQFQKLANLKADSKVRAVQKFATVWGIGAAQALKYYKDGYTDIKDILQDPLLSVMAKMGVKYYDDMLLRIPREEVAQVEKFMKIKVEELCPGASVNATGSYRRGHATCGDIDILISHQDGCSHEGLLAKLVEKLKSISFIADGLRVHDNNPKEGNHPDTFMGLCKLSNYPHYRRIDIKVYPKDAYAFALVAFTGNDVLNRKLRYLARMKGYKLSDQGLYIRESKKKDSKASTVSIHCESEEDVFAKLGVDFPQPHERDW